MLVVAVVVVVTVMAVTIVLHVMRGAVVSARAEPVGWFALECLFLHRVVVAVWSLVATWSALAHVLELFNAIGHDGSPLAE